MDAFALNSLPTDAHLLKVTAQPATHRGRAALRVELSQEAVAEGDYGDSNTMVVLPGEFGDGEIEVELLGTRGPTAPPAARGFIGIAFHVAPDASSFEALYLRPTNGRADDPVRRQRAVQYFAYPEWKFGRLREETPGVYESAADIGPDEWTRVRIAVEGSQARLYVGGAAEPALVVSDLKLGASRRGAIGLWVDIGTEGYFANLVVRHR